MNDNDWLNQVQHRMVNVPKGKTWSVQLLSTSYWLELYSSKPDGSLQEIFTASAACETAEELYPTAWDRVGDGENTITRDEWLSELTGE